MQLDFDSEKHVYSLGGRVLPSVTEILRPLEDFSRIPAEVLEAARDFGHNVHLACHLDDQEALEWDSLDPALVPYVLAWRKFLADTGAVVIASEHPLAHPTLGYAGTPDRVLAWGKRTVLPDIKSTTVVPRTVGPQTAGYTKLYQANHGGREPERYCIQLKPDGTYSSHRRPESTDWSVFLSCLNIWRFKNER
jgi:hypothetical protein